MLIAIDVLALMFLTIFKGDDVVAMNLAIFLPAFNDSFITPDLSTDPVLFAIFELSLVDSSKPETDAFAMWLLSVNSYLAKISSFLPRNVSIDDLMVAKV